MRLPVSVRLLLLPLIASLTGCSVSTRNPGTNTSIPGDVVGVHGKVHGGQQPVADSVIQIYAVGTTGDASAATPLLTHRVTTSDGSGNASNANANAGNGYNSLPAGSFQVVDTNYCPSASSPVYMTSTQGNPGLAPASTNNTYIALMAFLGTCGNLSASTNIIVNELTTVGSLAALSPYVVSPVKVGYNAGADTSAFLAAAALASEYTNFSSGSVPGPSLPAGYYASSTEINTLADILANCINSNGAAGGFCSQLASDATPVTTPATAPPADTVSLAANLVNNPTLSISTIFPFATPSAPFQPILPAAPASWALPIVPVPATPVISLAAGAYAGAQTLTLTDATSGTSIYYTTNGATPTPASTLYTGNTIALPASETIKAIASYPDYNVSNVASAAYTITSAVAAPVFSPLPGTYATSQTVSISSPSANASVYYTADGSIPTTASSQPFGGVYVGSSETLNAIAAVNGLPNSAVTTGGYVINTAAVNDVHTAVGGGGASFFPGSAAVSSYIGTPAGVAFNTNTGDMYVSGGLYTKVVYKISAAGLVSIVAGSGNGSTVSDPACYSTHTCFTSGSALSSSFEYPTALAVDSIGNLYIADTFQYSILKVTPAGALSVFAGGGSNPNFANGSPATSAQISYPNALAFDSAGNLYIGESEFSSVQQSTRILKVNTSGNISVVAGGGNSPITNGAVATSVTINGGQAFALDSSNNIYIAAAFGNGQGNNSLGAAVYKVTSSGLISLYAGSQTATGYNGDGFAATSTLLSYPTGLAADSSGNVYIADLEPVANGPSNAIIRKVNTSGIVSTVAGGQAYGGTYSSTQCSANPSIAIDTVVGQTYQMAFYGSSLYLAESGMNCVGRLQFANSAAFNVVPQAVITPNQALGPFTSEPSVIITDANSGAKIYYTTDGTVPTTSSTQYTGTALVPTANTLYIARAFVNGLTQSPLASGDYILNLPVVATPTFSVTPGTYTTVQTVSVSDATSGAAIYCTTNGTTPTTASAPYVSGTPFTVNATETIACIAALAGDANSAVGSAAYTINLPTAATPVFSVAAGTYTSSKTVSITSTSTATGAVIYYTTDGTTPTTASAVYSTPLSLSRSTLLQAVAAGTNFITSATASANYIFNYGTTGGIINEVAGNYGPQFPALASNPYAIFRPVGSAVDPSGNVYVAGSGCYTNYGSYPYVTTCNGLIYKVTRAGVISIFAGGGTTSEGTGGAATSIALGTPAGIATDAAGNIYFSDSGTYRICKITQAGTLSSIAGTGSSGYTGNGNLAVNATIQPPLPAALTLDANANIYFVDGANYASAIRKITASTGVITAYAGSEANAGSTGDTGLATAALFQQITGLATDSANNVYIVDQGNYRIREVTASTGKVNTIAGTGSRYSGSGSNGDNGVALSATFGTPAGIVVDPSNNVYIGDTAEIRVYSPTTLKIAPYIGNGTLLTCSYSGGTTYCPAGDGGSIASAGVYSPVALTQDLSGSIYITDSYYEDVREVSFGPQPTVATPVPSLATGTYNGAQTVTLTDATPNATIYYSTTSPVAPGNGNTFLYTGAFSVPVTETVYYAAFLAGANASTTGSSTYTLILPQDPAPTINPASGNYSYTFSVGISPSGKTSSVEQIYYTVDGTTPTTSSPYIYQFGSVIISGTTTLKAMSTASGYTNSPVVTATYTFPAATVAAPVFVSAYGNPPSILNYTGQEGTTINITSATPGAVIYYTTSNFSGGAIPTKNSSQWYEQSLYFGNYYTLYVTAIAYYNGVYSLPVTAEFYNQYP